MATYKYLDKTGLSRLWSKAKAKIVTGRENVYVVDATNLEEISGGYHIPLPKEIVNQYDTGLKGAYSSLVDEMDFYVMGEKLSLWNVTDRTDNWIQQAVGDEIDTTKYHGIIYATGWGKETSSPNEVARCIINLYLTNNQKAPGIGVPKQLVINFVTPK